MQKNNFNVFIPLLFAVVLAIGMQLGFKMYESIKGKPSKNGILVFIKRQGQLRVR
jgi:hypothetical protein